MYNVESLFVFFTKEEKRKRKESIISTHRNISTVPKNNGM